MNPTIDVKEPEDFRKVAQSGKCVAKIVGQVSIPDGLYFKNLQDIKFEGVGPNPTITGFPLFMIDVKNIEFKGIAFRLTRPKRVDIPTHASFDPIPPEKYEKWWGWRLQSTTRDGCENVTFEDCIWTGNTDEFAIHPNIDVDPTTKKSKWNVGDRAGKGLRFTRNVFGPSLQGKSIDDKGKKSREFHNFALSIGLWDDVVIEDSAFIGHNRRTPQVQGKGTIARCCMFGWGTMAIGLHKGSNYTLVDIYGNSSSATKLVTDVVGTNDTLYGSLDVSSCGVLNITSQAKAGGATLRDLECVQSTQNSLKATVLSSTTLKRASRDDILAKLPAFTQSDTDIIQKMKNGGHEKWWVADWT